ncbi:translation initiation factor IF-3, mitochondrial [Perognathus longimembris pacificus]|uniref:translation initiation factor IF-3, mitochondrial n=1 Tax=Perognathus longimembris pacificus TaxID=214514 RepID=UPI00201904AE|nr:translation initiation factor IF-3, mitochondrial [Perognathus longimembris pacificus]XP_048197558.1 translation initiation factor IF-3, mitochondrial [Perognathus longimembris pacificus]
MAASLLNRLILQAVKTENNCIRRCLSKHIIIKKEAPAQLFLIASGPRLSYLIHTKGFGTIEDTRVEKKEKKKSNTTFSNTGRKISERIIRVLDENGNDLGLMHRANVIKLMDERDLRLVQRNASRQPPEYQLMTGIQIHQERLRLREENKQKTGSTVTKELNFSSNIAQHDLNTKSKQIQQWIEKKYKVQVTIKKSKNADEPESKMEDMFNQILQGMPGVATFLTKPQAVKGGRAFTCVFRHLSKKEKAAYEDAQESHRRDALNKENGNAKESRV